MHIRELMSHPAVTCPVNVTLDAVARVMWEYDCGVVPLVDGDGRVAGIVTDRDICMAAYTQGLPLAEISASSAMSAQVFSCRPEDPVETAESLMSARQIRRLPVVDRDGHPVGVVAINDLTRSATRAKGNGMEHEVVETLAAIGRARQPIPGREQATVR